MTLFAKRELYDEDYMTKDAKGYPNILKDTEVELVKFIEYLYGKDARVKYKGICYDANPAFVEFEEK